jgi:hypothetical protein
METKECSRCQTVRQTSEFYKAPRYPDGFNPWCKACYRAWHRARYTPKDGADDSLRDCASCGESYRPAARRPSQYCSRRCKNTAKNARTAAALQGSKPTDRICMHCGDQLPQRMRADAIFCSVECNYKAHALQRKLRARTGEAAKPGYLRTHIANRDKWRCGICKKRVNRKLAHPDPLCASLDHVIPVSEGGTNDVWNLRLTHLVCNLSRRNVGGNEQLAML